jgi:hypothetical protein
VNYRIEEGESICIAWDLCCIQRALYSIALSVSVHLQMIDLLYHHVL